MRCFKVCTLITALFFYCSKLSFAESKTTYYYSLFSGWGLEIAVHRNNESQKNYLLVNTSDIVKEGFSFISSNYNHFVIVCDKAYYITPSIQCSAGGTTYNQGQGIKRILLGKSKITKEDVYILEVLLAKKQILVIPEQYLLVPDYQSQLGKYIKSVTGIEAKKGKVVSTDIKGKLTLLELRIKNRYGSDVGQLILHTLVIVLVALATAALALLSGITKRLYKSYCFKLSKPLFIFDNSIGDRIFYYDNNSKGNLFRLLLFILPVFIVTLALFTHGSTFYRAASLSLVVLIYVLIVFRNSKATFIINPSKMHTILFIGCFGVAIFTILSIPKKSEVKKPEQVNLVSLIPGNDNQLKLPYKKMGVKRDHYIDYCIRPDVRLFVDSLIVHDPKFTSVANVPWSHFISSGKYLVTAHSKEQYKKGILKYPQIASLLQRDKYSKYFMLFDNFSRKKASIIFYFDCTKDLPSTNVTINYYSPLSSDPIKFGKELTAMYFPGCIKDSTEGKYSVPIDLSFQEDTPYLYEIDVPKGYIKNIEINREEVPVKIRYLPDPGQSSLLYESNGTDGSSVTAYSLDITNPISFQREVTRTNISAYLNTLLDKNVIDKDFTLWSDKSVVLENSCISGQ